MINFFSQRYFGSPFANRTKNCYLSNNKSILDQKNNTTQPWENALHVVVNISATTQPIDFVPLGNLFFIPKAQPLRRPIGKIGCIN